MRSAMNPYQGSRSRTVLLQTLARQDERRIESGHEQHPQQSSLLETKEFYSTLKSQQQKQQQPQKLQPQQPQQPQQHQRQGQEHQRPEQQQQPQLQRQMEGGVLVELAPARRLVPQRLSLTSANAPLISTVPAPFAQNNERKRGLTAALYYSECYLRGIVPYDADSAALQAQKQYDKWWVNTNYDSGGQQQQQQLSQDESQPVDSKRRKLLDSKVSSISHRSDEDCKNGSTKSQSDNSDSISCNVNVPTDDDYTTNSNSSLSYYPRKRHDEFDSVSIKEISMSARYSAREILACKAASIKALKDSGGDTTSPTFLSHLRMLSTSYSTRGLDSRWSTSKSSAIEMDGTWLTLSKPNFTECQGSTDKGDCLYSLGRLSFDMFRPSSLKCSIQGVFNTICPQQRTEKPLPPLVCPTRLQAELHAKQAKRPVVREYDIVVALTIVGGQDKNGNNSSQDEQEKRTILQRPIRALLTNYGYCVPDPNVANRLTIWFKGGSLEVQDEESDLIEWKQLFDTKSIPNRSVSEYARLLAAKFILGAHIDDEISMDGSMRYTLNRPIGGHGHVFIDVLYADETLRIVQGHRGTIYVFTRIPDCTE